MDGPLGLASDGPGFESLPDHVTLVYSCHDPPAPPHPHPDLRLHICEVSVPGLRSLSLLLGEGENPAGIRGRLVFCQGLGLSQPLRWEDFLASQERGCKSSGEKFDFCIYFGAGPDI